MVAALLLEAAARDALRDPAAAGRTLERALDLAGTNSVLMASSSTRRRGCSSAMPGSAPRAPSLIAEVPSLLAATSTLAGPPGEPQRLHEPVRTVAITRKAKISPARRDIEHARRFRRLVKWRTGSEGRISYIKHRYGWDRTRLDGREGAAIWCGHGVFANNLVKISVLAS